MEQENQKMKTNDWSLNLEEAYFSKKIQENFSSLRMKLCNARPQAIMSI